MRSAEAATITGYILYWVQGGRIPFREYLKLCGDKFPNWMVVQGDLIKIWDQRDPYGHIARIRNLVLISAGYSLEDMERHWLPFYIAQQTAMTSGRPELEQQLAMAFRSRAALAGAKANPARLKWAA